MDWLLNGLDKVDENEKKTANNWKMEGKKHFWKLCPAFYQGISQHDQIDKLAGYYQHIFEEQSGTQVLQQYLAWQKRDSSVEDFYQFF